jgi:dinuclear metal center YbgI/SA1388 family protein
MRVADLITAIDRRYPFVDAAAWDPVGLQIGGRDRPAGLVAVAHEVLESTVTSAIMLGVGTIVAYHPLLFTPTTSFVEGPTAEGRALRLAEAGVSVIAVHTAMDVAEPGTGDDLLAALGLVANGVFFAVDDGDRPIGRLSTLAEPLAPGELVELVEDRLGVRVRATDGQQPIRRLAVVPGSGGASVTEAAEVADALVTGDVSHHRAREGVERGLLVVDAGHAATERPGIASLYAAVRAVEGDAIALDEDPTPWKD